MSEPITLEEALKWPPLGPMGLDPKRVIMLLRENAALRAQLDKVRADTWREAFMSAARFVEASPGRVLTNSADSYRIARGLAGELRSLALQPPEPDAVEAKARVDAWLLADTSSGVLAASHPPPSQPDLAKAVDDALKRSEPLVREARQIGRSLSGADPSLAGVVIRSSQPVAVEAKREPHPEALARLFHETYERLAPSHGYKTREASAKPWADVPEPNRALMTAVCRHIMTVTRVEMVPAVPSQPDASGATCATCDGTGKVQPPSLGMIGLQMGIDYTPQPCPDCNGSGKARAGSTGGGA